MESLNKHQLILLVLLISFVTSIATGVVTVSLMEEAPPAITQTINRVVEKTIERVVTEPSTQAAAVITKETIVVKADDAVIEAIEKNTGSIVRIKEVTAEGNNLQRTFVGFGLVVSRDGYIVADISVAYRRTDVSGNSIGESYIGVFPDGRVFPLNIAYTDQTSGIIFFQPLVQERERGAYKFAPPAYGMGTVKLGQAVVALGGEETNAVSTGIISNLIERSVTQPSGTLLSTTTPPEKTLVGIRTDIRTPELVPGGILLNLQGEVIGINAGSIATSRSTFTPIGKINELFSRVSASPTVR